MRTTALLIAFGLGMATWAYKDAICAFLKDQWKRYVG